MLEQEEKSVYLFCTEGSSDKEYHAHLRRQGDGWTVQYANGPRGRVGQTKLKTASALPFSDAAKAFEALVKSKIKSGYTESSTGVRFTNTDLSDRASGHIQQLPSSINEDAAVALLSNPQWAAQEKANGERRTVEVNSLGEVKGINKLGLYVNIPETWVAEFNALGAGTYDGEQVGDVFFAFDQVRAKDKDLKDLGFEQRYQILLGSLSKSAGQTPSIKLLTAAFSSTEKESLLKTIKTENLEGMVFKHMDAKYTAGRSDHALKYKLQESSTCIVIAKNQQRSVQIGLLNTSGAITSVGNVTIPANHEVPNPEDLVEVQYLYFNPSSSFEQPVYLGKRNDIQKHEANFLQVKRLKPGVEIDGDGHRISIDSDNSRERMRC